MRTGSGHRRSKWRASSVPPKPAPTIATAGGREGAVRPAGSTRCPGVMPTAGGVVAKDDIVMLHLGFGDRSSPGFRVTRSDDRAARSRRFARNASGWLVTELVDHAGGQALGCLRQGELLAVDDKSGGRRRLVRRRNAGEGGQITAVGALIKPFRIACGATLRRSLHADLDEAVAADGVTRSLTCKAAWRDAG